MNANLIIKASAGTGKTFAIATRYLQLLIFGKAKPEQILALTFSRAAAQEIYDKILERLWEASGANVATGGKTKDEIEKAKNAAAAKEKEHLLEGLPAEQRAQAEAAAEWTPAFFAGLLRCIIAAQHHDTIATLDSFIQRIVRSFPLEMGFQKDVSVLDDYGKSRAVEKAAEEVLAATVDNDGFSSTFKMAQGNDAVRSGLSKVQAAAKTWGEFLRDLAMKKKKEGQIQAQEWTADSMRQALGIEAAPQMPDLSSISVAPEEQKLLEDFKTYVAEFDETKDIFPNNTFGKMARFFCENSEATRYEYTFRKAGHVFDCGPEGAATIRAAVRWMAARMLNRKIDVAVAKIRLAKAVEDAYDAATRRKGLLTFSDFTDYQAVNENSQKGLALQNLQFRLDSRFDHWALDEFQDTSMPQWDCLRRLVEEALSGDGRSIMAVGDFKQSIYAWRGGDDKPFRELIQNVSDAAGSVESIDLSYRYQERTANFVNAIFCPENIRAVADGQCAEGVRIWEQDCWPKRGHLAKGTDDYVEIVGVAADSGDGDGESDNDGDNNDDGDLKPSAAMRVLAQPICDCVRDLWEKHEAAKSTETIGILVRNNADGLYLAERLRAMEPQKQGAKKHIQVPVVWEGQSGVLDSPIVRAVLELLWLAEHPEDKFSWAVVDIIFPLRKTVFREEVGWTANFPRSADSPAAVSSAVSKCLSRMGLARTLRAIVSALKDGDTKLDDRSLMRLDELVREGVNFEARPDADVGVAGFRRYLQSVTDREIAASPDVVRILTIHRSKGLSIDHVIVPVTEKGSTGSLMKPKTNRIVGEGWALESLSEKLAIANEKTRAAWEEAANGHFLEDLRTWYVALTRAKKSTRVFAVDEDHNAVQFRDLLRRPFASSTAKDDFYGTILHADGTPPSFGRKEGDVVKETPRWIHDKGRNFVSHATPSTGSGASHAAFARKATHLFDAKFDDPTKHGTDEHTAFAEIERIIPAAPKDDRERKILDWGGAWCEAFVLPADVPVWRERSYELFDKDKNEWETGQFDRVVFQVKDGVRTAEIYDFKTNKRSDGESVEAYERRMRDHYAGQMAAYRSAISRLCGIEPESISSTLLLTVTGTTVKVE